MKVFISSILILVFTSSFYAQNTHDKIHATLMDYIEGTSYNYVDRIENAFHKESELFLDGKNDDIWIVPSAKYISWFTDKKEGEFNGRIGNILSIEYFGNIASAKAEILIPARGIRYVDMFILKEEAGAWKIISKTANSKPTNKTGDKILFITSNANYYGESDIRTGNSFAELVNAYDTFESEGYTVDIVSPSGGDIPIAYLDYRDDLQMKYIRNQDFMYAISHTKSPDMIDPSEYKAVYYVGGGSAMFNVPENEKIHAIVMAVYEEQKGVVSAVCHGTAGIVHLKTKDGKYLVDGKVISGYPDEYESKDRPYFKTFPFLIGETIKSRGGDFKYSPRNNVHVESDARVVTGQNHLSSKKVAQKVIEYLQEGSRS